MKIKAIFLFVLLLLIVPARVAAEEVEIKASINADKIGLDDVLVFTVTIKGINNPTQPAVSDLDQFKVVQTSRSTEFRFINGVSSYYTNFVYYLTPQKTGVLTVPPVIYKYEGKHYETDPFKVEVVKGSVTPRTPRTQRRFPSLFDDEDDPFMRSPLRRTQTREIDIKLKAEVSKRKALIGEPIEYRILLLSRNRVQSVNPLSNLSFPGFWQEWFPIPDSIMGESKTIDGKVYQVYEVRKAILFPNRTGSVVIPSMEFELGLLDDAFSLFSNRRKITRSTQEITVQVSELPPEAVGLPVGDFTFDVTPDKKKVDINDILTLRMKIRARKGNIKTLEIPQVKTSEYYKVYPSKISKDTNFNQDRLTGVVEVEIPVSFLKTGRISFPAMEFKFYNPDASIVVTHKSSPFSIDVVGTKEKQDEAVTVARTDIIKKGEDIDFIKKGDIYNQENYYYRTGFYKFLLAVFFLVNLLFLLKILVYDRFIAGSTALKKRKLLNNTLNRLGKVRQYGEISSIIEDYLKEKTGLGLSGINNHSIETLFTRCRVNDGDIKVFIKVKSDSELSRFSPQKDDDRMAKREEERKLKHDLKQLIEILKRIDGRIK